MRLLVYDTELLFSEVLAALLERRGHAVVACASAWPEGALRLGGEPIDACLISTGGDLDVIGWARRQHPHAVLVALWGEPDLQQMLGGLRSGADGACLKHDGIDEIEDVLIRAIHARRRGTGGPIWSRAAQAMVNRRRPPRSVITLTEKERAVLDLLISGAGTSSMAERLGVGEATVRTHLQHLFSKFGVHSRVALIAQAVRSKTIQLDDGQELTAVGERA